MSLIFLRSHHHPYFRTHCFLLFFSVLFLLLFFLIFPLSLYCSFIHYILHFSSSSPSPSFLSLLSFCTLLLSSEFLSPLLIFALDFQSLFSLFLFARPLFSRSRFPRFSSPPTACSSCSLFLLFLFLFLAPSYSRHSCHHLTEYTHTRKRARTHARTHIHSKSQIIGFYSFVRRIFSSSLQDTKRS